MKLLHRSFAILAIGTGLAVATQLATISSAQACSFAADPAHEIDSASSDTTAPSAISIAETTISRGVPDCGGGGLDSCADIGTISLTLDPPSDNETPAEQFGFVLRVAAGQAPEGLFSLDSGAVRFPTGVMSLRWVDGVSAQQESFDFDLGITPVDLAGNLGPETIVKISAPGSSDACSSRGDGGCKAIGGIRTWGDLAIGAIVVIGALLLRRRFY